MDNNVERTGSSPLEGVRTSHTYRREAGFSASSPCPCGTLGRFFSLCVFWFPYQSLPTHLIALLQNRQDGIQKTDNKDGETA